MSEKDWSQKVSNNWLRCSVLETSELTNAGIFLSDVLFVLTGSLSVRNIRFNNPTISWSDSDISGHFGSEFSSSGVFFSPRFFFFFCSDPSEWKQILLHDYLNPSFKCAVYDFTLHCCTTQHHNGGQRCRFSVLSCKLVGFFFSVWKKKEKKRTSRTSGSWSNPNSSTICWSSFYLIWAHRVLGYLIY